MTISIETLKILDGMICKEADVSVFAKLIGYNEIGEPIEIVYDLSENGYAFHVGGERKGEASNFIVEQCRQQLL